MSQHLHTIGSRPKHSVLIPRQRMPVVLSNKIETIPLSTVSSSSANGIKAESSIVSLIPISTVSSPLLSRPINQSNNPSVLFPRHNLSIFPTEEKEIKPINYMSSAAIKDEIKTPIAPVIPANKVNSLHTLPVLKLSDQASITNNPIQSQVKYQTEQDATVSSASNHGQKLDSTGENNQTQMKISSIPPIQSSSTTPQGNAGQLNFIFRIPGAVQTSIPYSSKTMIRNPVSEISTTRTINYVDKNYVSDGEFQLKFPSAGPLSALLDYLFGSHYNMWTERNYFELNDEGLIYLGFDPNKIILNYLIIPRENMLLFDKKTENNKPYRIHLDAEALKTLVKDLRKDMTPVFTKKKNDIRIFITPSEHVHDDVQFIEQLKHGKMEPPKFPKINYVKNEPNAVIPTADLKQFFKTIKSKMLTQIAVHGNRIVFARITDKGADSAREFFTSLIGRDSAIIHKGYISSNIAKNLGKLHTLAPTGLVKVYADKASPKSTILFILQAGFLGELKIYIQLNS